MSKLKAVDKFFERKIANDSNDSSILEPSSLNALTHEQEQCEPKRPRLNPKNMNVFHVETGLGLRPMISKFSINQKDEILNAYLKCWPCQSILKKYVLLDNDHFHRFQASWFEFYHSSLKYSY